MSEMPAKSPLEPPEAKATSAQLAASQPVEPVTDSAVSLELPADLEAVDRRIAQLALLCRARLLQLPVLERILDNDRSVCAAPNERAFTELRGLLYLHFRIQQELAEGLGPQDSRLVIERVLQRLRASLGAHLAELQ